MLPDIGMIYFPRRALPVIDGPVVVVVVLLMVAGHQFVPYEYWIPEWRRNASVRGEGFGYIHQFPINLHCSELSDVWIDLFCQFLLEANKAPHSNHTGAVLREGREILIMSCFDFEQTFCWWYKNRPLVRFSKTHLKNMDNRFVRRVVREKYLEDCWHNKKA